ncbi:MAG: sigma-54 interaction domain-containing protein [Bacteroidota bacterium]|jgi:transcriptional regulator with PAS, ATPase and Fis domain
MNIQEIKQRYGIIGNSPLLEHAIDTARQVAPTDITVLITGESGTGKEVFPQIIHGISSRKHGPYIAVNCGAIPEGTIDSELFGHEKGAFTGAHEARKGYFEVVNGGTIFLDEVAELPLLTQVRLLRVLETGEFIKVGSSKVIKTNVRVVAATNVDIPQAIRNGKFREDLYYRLNTVPIQVPSLRQRKEDIQLLFRKFSADFADRYRMPAVTLTPDAVEKLTSFAWPGNVRQLKNITEQLSILERNKTVNGDVLRNYLPDEGARTLPIVAGTSAGSEFTERDLLYKVLFDMRKDIVDLKKLVLEMISSGGVTGAFTESHAQIIDKLYQEVTPGAQTPQPTISIQPVNNVSPVTRHDEIVDENLSLEEREKETIKKAIEKHRGRRKHAARELGISERTLYRKIKEYDL